MVATKQCGPMWKEDGRGRPLIPKGEPHALHVIPPWGHFLVGHHEDKEMIVEDAHDARTKREEEEEICCGVMKYIEIWEKCCLENETYY